MAITLVWSGPLGPGTFPADAEGIAALDIAAVYLRVKVYRADRLVAYVGQTTQLISRIDQHLTRLIGLTHTLRSDSGEVVYDAAFDSRLRAFNELEELGPTLLAEANRMRFYYAQCDESFHDDYLDLIEHCLKARIESQALALGFACENLNAVALRTLPEDGDTVDIVNEVGDLAPVDQEWLRSLLGDAPIRIALGELEGAER